MSDYAWDVFVYHDFSSSERPEKGKSFPGFGEENRVVAVGPPLTEDRTATVVLAFGGAPMPEVEALLRLGRFAELLETLNERGEGVTLMPVRKGTLMGGVGSEHRYEFDGWEVGYVTPVGGGELAVGPTVTEAVEGALAALDDAEA